MAWNECLRQLRRELPKVEFDTWIRPLRVQGRQRSDTLRLAAPNRYILEEVERSYLARIQHLVQQGSDRPVAVLLDRPSRRSGVFCLETVWGLTEGLDEAASPATRSLLELLEKLTGMPYVYRDVSTRAEADYCLGRWVGRDTAAADYRLGNLGILYLGFQGSAGGLSFDDGDEVNLDDLASSLKNNAEYDCRGSVIHFAACSVLRAHRQVEDFKNDVRAAAVSGYTRQTDFPIAWAFELMYLERLGRCNFDNPDTLRTCQRDLANKPVYSALAEQFGFKMIV